MEYGLLLKRGSGERGGGKGRGCVDTFLEREAKEVDPLHPYLVVFCLVRPPFLFFFLSSVPCYIFAIVFYYFSSPLLSFFRVSDF